MPSILALTITLMLPGYGEKTTTIERPMPSMERCQQAGRDLVATNDQAHRYEFACRVQS